MDKLKDISAKIWRLLSNTSAAWSLLPARIQDLLQPYIQQLVVATMSAVVFGVWAILYKLPPPVSILCALGAFAIGFSITNQLKFRKHLGLLQSTFVPSHGIPEPQLPIATAAQLVHDQIRGVKVYLQDLTRDTALIKRKRFERCVINGPAVLYLINNVKIAYSSFSGADENEAYLLEVEEDRRSMLGIIGIEECSFEHCWFIGIGFVGKRDQVAKIRDAFRM